ncbi:hypothetical protein ABZ249_01105 [Nocardiopsis sp. NPDC006139]|uniref:hypothetical protein n=1 Tax=Nocardiopsis sp. NPDC006139 TaxID=3154578 RepID=UPI0033A51B7A
MSWNIVLMRLPHHVTSVADLTDDDAPPPIGPAAGVLDRLRTAFPGVDLSDPAWGFLEEPGARGAGWLLELVIGDRDPVESLMVRMRGGGSVPAVLYLADLFDCRALDLSSGDIVTWDDWEQDGGSRARFQEDLARALGRDRGRAAPDGGA